MALIADILLVAGALGTALYCMILARRLRRFNDLEKGVGGAIAALSTQVDDMTRALDAARSSAQDSSGTLTQLTDRADGVAQRLELLVASLHDVPMGDEKPKQTELEPKSTSERPLSFIRSRAVGKPDPLILRGRPEVAE
ncbi:DUF6468 domain-containing protein [Actibacterium lipolyticum]|uniref:Chemotaxis protein n=1 Tax=Actibacterium lipolyticum TaxID=1524263 RepID=A0A238KZ70_9RHOB|nr:DUF6468 domain-containing protein [Actibacterium lipolyticum]SMX47376.1 hypothetical protein COL8621_03422 [Actibacterium lipolyticum]